MMHGVNNIKICQSCFNVNFNIVFKTVHLCKIIIYVSPYHPNMTPKFIFTAVSQELTVNM
jgi:hypothetical protein